MTFRWAAPDPPPPLVRLGGGSSPTSQDSRPDPARTDPERLGEQTEGGRVGSDDSPVAKLPEGFKGKSGPVGQDSQGQAPGSD